MTSLSD